MSPRIFTAIVAALGTGTAIALQSTMNGRAGAVIGPIHTGLLVNAIGGAMAATLIACIAAVAALGSGAVSPVRLSGHEIQAGRILSWIAVAGALGILIIMGVAFSVQGVGVTAGLAAIIVAQLIAGLLIDRVGGSGSAAIAVDWRRIAGVALMFGGVWLLVPRG